ncbi:hypothetical protein CBS101457_003805 [Exobasidium rhododendri]|nr:hypothetical protein CBS101457_003805 [Exobasidium rhododendri]
MPIVHLLSLIAALFSLIAATTQSTTYKHTARSTPGPYPVHYTGVPTIDAAIACDQLQSSIPVILAARLHEPLQLNNVISKTYLEGENPSTTALFDDIPQELLQPSENIDAAISSLGEWDRESVMADVGYGEENNVQILDGGLPSFCRFGANIVTSDQSNVWFEVWMPLPSNATTTDAISNSTVLESRDVIQAFLKARRGSKEAADGPASRDGWRGRLVFLGNGGQRGSVNYPEMKQVITRYREAAASTNGGHFGSASLTNWTIGNVPSQVDFGHRAVHVSTVASQAVVKEFFGVKDRKTSKGRRRTGFPSYFKGCSTGGRQGFAEAQNYPKDYDGILAGSPAIYYNDLNAYQIHVNSLQANTTSPRYIPKSLYKVIHKHIIAKCDLIDGVQDAVVQDPAKCQPAFQDLLCPNDSSTSASNDTPTESLSMISDSGTTTGKSSTTAASPTSISSSTDVLLAERKVKESESTVTASPSCLSADQLGNLEDIYKSLRYPDGRIIHEPVLYGSENVWTVTDGVVGTPFPPAPGWFQYQVLNRTDKVTDFDPNVVVEGNYSLIQFGHDLDPGGTNTEKADLTEYFETGSKILHYHGLSDQLIPSGASNRYHGQVKEVSRLERPLDHYYRYFHIPGMGHCRGGDGAWNFGGGGQADADGSRPLRYNAHHDALLALFEWVEYATPPEFIIGAAYKNSTDELPSDIGNSTQLRPYSNGVKYTHKMCPYPKQAVLTDPDNPYAARSLECR